MNENIDPLSTQSLEDQKIEDLRKIMNEKVLENNRLWSKINKFGHYLENKYPDSFNYRLFRFVVGSIPPEKGCPKFDFEGEDSVEKFIRSL